MRRKITVVVVALALVGMLAGGTMTAAAQPNEPDVSDSLSVSDPPDVADPPDIADPPDVADPPNVADPPDLF